MSSITKSKLQASRKKGRELEFFVYPNMAKAANKQIHHQANSASLTSLHLILTSFSALLAALSGPTYGWMGTSDLAMLTSLAM
jgi:hypothetical protein